MSINLTDEIEIKTKKGKLGAAKQIFLEGDTTSLQESHEYNQAHFDTLDNRSSQMEESIKNISVTGGASVADAVTYDNTTSGLEAVNVKGAVDELAKKSKEQDTEITKKANSADVTSQMQAEQTRVNAELDKKFNSENIAQESGDAEDKVMSQKAVSNKLSEISTNKLNKIDLPLKDVKENGVYFVDELGNAFMLYSPEIGLKASKISKDMADKVLAFLSLAQELGTSENLPISQKAVKDAIENVNANFLSLVKEEGAYLCNEKGEVFARFVNGNFEAGSNHPMYGKHFFVFGDSHTEAPAFGLWQMFCELTGAIYHTLLRKKASDGTYHFFSATTSTTDYTSLIDEEDTGIEVNCDGFNWAQYAHAAYTYAQYKGFNVDYILVENCHFNKWNFYNDDGSVKENVPIVLLNKTKVYSQIFEDAMAVMNFVNRDENVAKVVDELGFDSIDSSFDLKYGTASQELVFSFSEGNSLSTDCVAKIHFGDDTSKTISTTLSSGMSLTDCVDAINQWAFDEYSTWVNPTKGTQGNTKILLNYSSEIGGDSSAIANFEVTNSANLVMQQPSISVKATSWIHEYGLKDTSGLKKSSSWLRSGGSVNWSLPNAMLGAMQYMGEHSPKTKFVFLGIWNNEMKEEYKYANGSVNPYDLMKSSSYKNGQISKKSIKDIAELFGWQYIDVDKLCGITPFNVTPTFNNYNNVHMKKDGYRVSAECIAKYIK